MEAFCSARLEESHSLLSAIYRSLLSLESAATQTQHERISEQQELHRLQQLALQHDAYQHVLDAEAVHHRRQLVNQHVGLLATFHRNLNVRRKRWALRRLRMGAHHKSVGGRVLCHALQRFDSTVVKKALAHMLRDWCVCARRQDLLRTRLVISIHRYMHMSVARAFDTWHTHMHCTQRLQKLGRIIVIKWLYKKMLAYFERWRLAVALRTVTRY